MVELLRSPSNPITMRIWVSILLPSLLPHKQDLIRSSVIEQSTCLNPEPMMFEGVSSTADIPLLSGEGLELTVLKSEKNILHAGIETWKKLKRISKLGKGNGAIVEWDCGPVSVKMRLALDLSPFEIKTYKVRFR